MKKIIIIFINILILCACSAKREEYYVFSFDDKSLAVGFDNVEIIKENFSLDIKKQINDYEVIKDVDLYYDNKPIALINISNYQNQTVDSNSAIISRLVYFFEDYKFKEYKIDGTTLKESIKENCDIFKGTYIERNGYACVFNKTVNKNINNVVIMHGDILSEDQDKLNNIEIYIERAN